MLDENVPCLSRVQNLGKIEQSAVEINLAGDIVPRQMNARIPVRPPVSGIPIVSGNIVLKIQTVGSARRRIFS